MRVQAQFIGEKSYNQVREPSYQPTCLTPPGCAAAGRPCDIAAESGVEKETRSRFECAQPPFTDARTHWVAPADSGDDAPELATAIQLSLGTLRLRESA